MSLYRVGRVWYIDIQHDGKRIRESARTADKKEAQEYHDERRAGIWRNAKLGDPLPRTLRDAIGSWLAEKERDLSDRYRINALPSDLRSRLLSDLTTERLDAAIQHMAPSSYNRTANLLTAILNHAHARGWMLAVPKMPRKKVDDKRVRWLTAEEWGRLKDKLPGIWREMAEFTLATGLRENNVLGLKWDQVDMRRQVAWAHADETKAGRGIGVPLNESALAVLRARRSHAKEKGGKVWVFANNATGEPYYKASSRVWYEALRQADLVGLRWHDLRHTWASWHVMSGTRLEELQRLGGWKTLAMVTRYAHLAPEHLAEVAKNVRPVSLRERKSA